jgi:hypothetical protein
MYQFLNFAGFSDHCIVKLNAREKTLGAGEKIEDFETHFRIKWCYRRVKFHEAPHIATQPYGVHHGILRVFNTILNENEFQYPQIFHQHLRFSPEHSTLDEMPRAGPALLVLILAKNR